MRRVLIGAVLLLVAGCGTSGTLDPAVVADLRVAVAATLDGMAVPAEARPSARALEDQVNLLALQVDQARVGELREGAYDQARLREDAAALVRWIGRQQAEHGLAQEPPAMIAWLTAQPRLDARQRLLLHALIRQGQRETGFKPEER